MGELLAKLVARFQPVSERRSGLGVALWGGPGIGKTHTAQRLLHALPCRAVTVHSCAPTAQLATALARPAGLPGWAERTLTRAARAGHTPPTALAEALAAQLRQLAPVLLHVEDLHDAPPARRELLLHLAQAVPHLPGAGLLVTSRSEPPAPLEPLRVAPLSPAAAYALLEAAAGDELPPAASAWIHARAAGNPLFTREYFRHLTRRGHLWHDGEAWRWSEPEAAQLPATIEALIEGLLADATREPVLAAAVRAKAHLPPYASDEELARSARLDSVALAAAVVELHRCGVLEDGAFAHPLYREVAARLPPPHAGGGRPASGRLEVLGPMRFVRGGATVEVHGERRRALLALLLEARLAGRAGVPQLQLLDQLYPREPDRAAGALKQLVFQLRAALGPEVIVRMGGGYALGPVASDAEAFLRDGNCAWWRGPYLEGIAITSEEAVGEQLRRALRVRAEGLLSEDPREAARLARLLTESEPFDLAALRLELAALRAAGGGQELERRYRAARATFAEVGESLPRDWAELLRDGE